MTGAPQPSRRDGEPAHRPVSRHAAPLHGVITSAQWMLMRRILKVAHVIFGAAEWTAAEAAAAGVFAPTGITTGRQADKAMLRAMSGVPIHRRMLTAGSKPRTWRVVTAATRRPSAEFDRAAFEGYGDDWFGIEGVMHYLELTPFADIDLDAETRLAAWEAWARVEHCTCGQFGALHAQRHPKHRMWRVTPHGCRRQTIEAEEFVATMRDNFGEGMAFYADDLVLHGIDATAIGALPGNAKSTGRALGRLADQQPPGETGRFLVRLGAGTGQMMAFCVASWDMVLRLDPDVRRTDAHAPPNAVYAWT